jgi:hypothetical protein
MMGKRSSFARRPQDYYRTPPDAVTALLPHLPAAAAFIEPCAGDGTLVGHLMECGHACVYACDVRPRNRLMIHKRDALALDRKLVERREAKFIITNPPWSRPILHQMIEHFSDLLPTWLLIDANWIFTRQAAPYLKRCVKIVTIGRVKWIANSPSVGKDDAAWMLFTRAHRGQPRFYGQRDLAVASGSATAVRGAAPTRRSHSG